MKAQKFARKPFVVTGVQVTAENLDEVAEWCGGDVREASRKPGKAVQKYVKVRVLRPLNEKQTMAFPGDWILYAGTSYKVYTTKAFFETFEPVGDSEEEHEESGRVLADTQA